MKFALNCIIFLCASFGLAIFMLFMYFIIYHPIGFTSYEVFITALLSIFIVKDIILFIGRKLED